MGMLIPLASPAVVLADIRTSLCGAAQDQTVNSTKTCADTSGSENRFQEILATIINVFSLIVGVAAVIMIIFAGFKYITSGGNQESVKTAKQALIYALIGLIIVALAQIIVKFVLNQATNPASSSSIGQACDPTKPDPEGYTCKCTHDESGTTCTLVKK